MRHGSVMRPTARAEQIALGVREALEALTGTLADTGRFVPSTSTQEFVLAATDFTVFAVLPQLVAEIAREAPRIRLRVLYSTHPESVDELASGRVHFALSFQHKIEALATGLESLDCFDDDYVVAVRNGHQRIRKKLSLAQYLAERHVVVTPWNTEQGIIDAALASSGLTRDVAVKLPSVMAAPFIVANSELLLTLPRRVALQLADAIPLAIHPTPFEAPRYVLKVFFHRRHSGSPAHRWMREKMMDVLGAIPRVARTSSTG
ncbi:LysR substrate-binding domain-containing protein [Paraburkholderia jirisanensis]